MTENIEVFTQSSIRIRENGNSTLIVPEKMLKKAAELINVIRPDVAIPTHYGSVVGSEEDAKVFAGNVKEPIKVEIKKQY